MWICPKCNEQNEGDFLTCWNCCFERDGVDKKSGSVNPAREQEIKEETKTEDKEPEEYPALMVLTKLLVVGGWVGAILVFILGMVLANEAGILTFLVSTAISFFIVTCSYAIGELIKLLIAIEINTRNTRR